MAHITRREARIIAIGNSVRAKYGRKRYRDNRVATEVTGQQGKCWCGLAYAHDWPGKDGTRGAPHPPGPKRPAPVPSEPEPGWVSAEAALDDSERQAKAGIFWWTDV